MTLGTNHLHKFRSNILFKNWSYPKNIHCTFTNEADVILSIVT